MEFIGALLVFAATVAAMHWIGKFLDWLHWRDVLKKGKRKK